MVHNGLKLNRNETELVLISSKFPSRPCLEIIQVDVENVENTNPNLRSRFGIASTKPTMLKKSVSCHYHLRNIAKIRKYLSEKASEI